jgi:hypothetical protein
MSLFQSAGTLYSVSLVTNKMCDGVGKVPNTIVNRTSMHAVRFLPKYELTHIQDD